VTAAARVIVADDSVLFREGLAQVLTSAGFQVVGQAGTAARLLELVGLAPPEMVVLDIRMPPTQTTEGLEAATIIAREHPGVGILLLSHYVETHHAVRLLAGEAGGVGYLLKDRVSDLEKFIEAARAVAAGHSVIDPEVVSQLISRRRNRDLLSTLTGREQSVLALMAEGRSNSAICQKLFLSSKTVEAHVRSIFSKLDLGTAPSDHRRVLAVLAYLRS
jgi:DNA-binding NarL/FixJ family response regulator